jgi:beta-glucosidase
MSLGFHLRTRLLCFAFLAVTYTQAQLASGSAPASLQVPASAPFSSPQLERWIDGLLQQMTLEEKVGQLNQYSAGTPTGPGTGRSGYGEMIEKGQIGSLFNLTGAEKVNAMQRIAVEKSRLHIPILFGLDVIHGYRTTFPIPLAMSASWDLAMIEHAARIAAHESAAEGIRWTFSPMVDIARDARWGRITEGAGEDPFLGAAVARAYVNGYQGDLKSADSIAACAKHFVGYGAAEAGREYNPAEISEHTLREIYLPPFKAAADAGALSFMSSFNTINGVPATADAFTLRHILRGEWGYKGLVVSDWTSVAELIEHGIANDGRTAAKKAALTGVDMDMESNLYESHLAELVRSGEVPEKLIDESVRNVLRVKFLLGLFEHPYVAPGEDVISSTIPQASREVSRKIAEESFVLLKNDTAGGRPILPLQVSPGTTVAVIGPMADSSANMQGAWVGMGRPEDVVTLRKALEDYAKPHGIKLLFAEGTPILGGNGDFAAAIHAAQDSDIVILTVGEEAATMTGEAASRTRLELPGMQEQLVAKVAALGKPTALIVFSGRPLVLSNVVPQVSAVLEAWFPGVEAGPALVRILFGESNPSGRLTATFPRSVGQEPLYYNALNTGRPVGEVDLSHPPSNPVEKYHSRYIDETNSPLYPFGYGLSYSSFTYSQPVVSTMSVSAAAMNRDDPLARVKVSAQVKNTSQRAGNEVVQLYIGQRGTSIARPRRELKGFQRITLAPGESRTVEFVLDREALSFWNVDSKFTAEPSEVNVWVSHDSASGTPVMFTVAE